VAGGIQPLFMTLFCTHFFKKVGNRVGKIAVEKKGLAVFAANPLISLASPGGFEFMK
jgi:hypothetical protein